MNMAKTQLMVLNRKSKSSKIEQIQVTVNGTELSKQSSVKYLVSILTKISPGRQSRKPPSMNMSGYRGWRWLDVLDTAYLVTLKNCYINVCLTKS